MRFPVQERYSYLVKFYQDDDLYGMYVWAINEDEAKSQVRYCKGNVRFKEVVRDYPKTWE